jgi:hypothetical protein
MKLINMLLTIIILTLVACGQGNNDPWEGYVLLYRALASNPTTSMGLWWSTDIQYQP